MSVPRATGMALLEPAFGTVGPSLVPTVELVGVVDPGISEVLETAPCSTVVLVVVVVVGVVDVGAVVVGVAVPAPGLNACPESGLTISPDSSTASNWLAGICFN